MLGSLFRRNDNKEDAVLLVGRDLCEILRHQELDYLGLFFGVIVLTEYAVDSGDKHGPHAFSIAFCNFFAQLVRHEFSQLVTGKCPEHSDALAKLSRGSFALDRYAPIHDQIGVKTICRVDEYRAPAED